MSKAKTKPSKTDNVSSAEQIDEMWLPQVPLPWQHAVWSRLTESIQQDRLPHALMFSGQAGLGKLLVAKRFAHLLLCDQREALLNTQLSATTEPVKPCGECKGCRLTSAGNHIDLLHVGLEDGATQIKIDQIRALAEFMVAKPRLSDHRVVILEPAHSMTVAAANALLKSLEEPSHGCHILLVTDRLASILPTVRSRCQRIPFLSTSFTDQEAWLLQQPDLASVHPEQLRAYWSAAGGTPLNVMAYHRNEWGEVREQFLRDFAAIIVGRKTASETQIAQRWEPYLTGPLLSWLAEWTRMIMRALLMSKVGHVPSPIEQTLLDYLKEGGRIAEGTALSSIHARALFAAKVYDCHRSIIASQKLIQNAVSLNKRLFIEDLLIKWRGMLFV